ncbi:MAG TPA: 2'-5' RNA ligase family protein [Flavisolibacter sp.]|nr:2'-5' RNA ligase family protein [Flavisolibacter sp.]
MLITSVQQPAVTHPVMNWVEDYGVWEHLLVINPSLNVAEKIYAEKKKFTSTYQDPAAIIGKPHITIAAFLATDEMKPTLIRWVQAICNGRSRFPVLLRNFSGFVPQTIYIKVQNGEPFKQLAKSLKALDYFIRASECPPLKLTTTPRLTIARHMSEETYFKALPAYLQLPFQESFIATELTLIKRATSYGRCETVHVFPLAPEQPTHFN